MEIRTADCPLGAKCEEVKTDGGKQYIARCPWYVHVRGTDNNTGEEMDHFACAIAWMPTLMVQTANESRRGAAATVDFRNHVMNARPIQTAEALRAIRLNDVDLLEGEHEANGN